MATLIAVIAVRPLIGVCPEAHVIGSVSLVILMTACFVSSIWGCSKIEDIQIYIVVYHSEFDMNYSIVFIDANI